MPKTHNIQKFLLEQPVKRRKTFSQFKMSVNVELNDPSKNNALKINGATFF